MLPKLLKYRPWLVLAALITLFAGNQAAAQTYTLGVGTAAFGTVASGASGDTEFTISATTGLVTKDVGNGGRVSTSSAVATITVSCGNQNACNSTNVNVKVGTVGSPTGRLKAISSFNVANGSGTVSNISGSNPLTFRLSPIGKQSSKTFKLGMNFKLHGDDSGKAVGAATSGFYVSVAASPTTPASSGTNGSLSATVYRSLALAKTADINFGRIVKPSSGSGTITLNSNGTRSSSGAVWLASPFPSRAGFLATGDGGKVLAVTIDPTFTMNKQGPPSCPNPDDCKLVVTTNNTISGTPVLGAGASGTYSFLVGGSFPITSSTASGSYTGTFNVTVAYN